MPHAGFEASRDEVARPSTEGAARQKRLAVNKRLASLRFSYLCHRMPGLRWLGRRIPPQVYFKWSRQTAHASYHIYPSDRRRLRYLRQAVQAVYPDESWSVIAKKNLHYRQWLKILTHGWPSWAEQCRNWTRIEGESHLQNALTEGKGAILLSGHSYGFNSMVAPVLSQLGYRLHRTGRGHWGDPADRWGRAWQLENWEYNSFGQDFWQHVRALNKMHVATQKKNEIVHLLVTGFPHGEPVLEVGFYHKKFFLDPVVFRTIETLKAPVLPCFALCDNLGRLVISLGPSLKPNIKEIMEAFGPLYSRHLRERPEFGFFWRKIVRQQEGW